MVVDARALHGAVDGTRTATGAQATGRSDVVDVLERNLASEEQTLELANRELGGDTDRPGVPRDGRQAQARRRWANPQLASSAPTGGVSTRIADNGRVGHSASVSH
jgi:hypothetical protein